MKYLSDDEERVRELGNGFSDYGTLVHAVLESFATGELKADQCLDAYEMMFAEAVVNPYPSYPPNMKENAYKRGQEYFSNFVGFGDLKIIAAEHELVAPLGPYKFKGIVDLILLNEKTGKYVIVDHKTKSDSSMKKELQLYKKQLYLYAHLIMHNYGYDVGEMWFNMINAASKKGPIKFVFDRKEYEEAVQWAIGLIEEILLSDDFPGNYDGYFCENICGFRDGCEVRQENSSEFDTPYL